MTAHELAEHDKKRREAGVNRTIANAVMLAGDPDWSRLRLYNIAAEVISEMDLPDDEREQAILTLKEEMKI